MAHIWQIYILNNKYRLHHKENKTYDCNYCNGTSIFDKYTISVFVSSIFLKYTYRDQKRGLVMFCTPALGMRPMSSILASFFLFIF